MSMKMIIPRDGASSGSGRIRAIQDPDLTTLMGTLGTDIEIKRASHVEPGAGLSQTALQAAYEDSLPSATCVLPVSDGYKIVDTQANKWFADMTPVSGPVLGPFATRDQATAAELDWLDMHNIPLPVTPATVLQQKPVSATRGKSRPSTSDGQDTKAVAQLGPTYITVLTAAQISAADANHVTLDNLLELADLPQLRRIIADEIRLQALRDYPAKDIWWFSPWTAIYKSDGCCHYESVSCVYESDEDSARGMKHTVVFAKDRTLVIDNKVEACGTVCIGPPRAISRQL